MNNRALRVLLGTALGTGAGAVFAPGSRDNEGRKTKPTLGKRLGYAAMGGAAGGFGGVLSNLLLLANKGVRDKVHMGTVKKLHPGETVVMTDELRKQLNPPPDVSGRDYERDRQVRRVVGEGYERERQVRGMDPVWRATYGAKTRDLDKVVNKYLRFAKNRWKEEQEYLERYPEHDTEQRRAAVDKVIELHRYLADSFRENAQESWNPNER